MTNEIDNQAKMPVPKIDVVIAILFAASYGILYFSLFSFVSSDIAFVYFLAVLVSLSLWLIMSVVIFFRFIIVSCGQKYRGAKCRWLYVILLAAVILSFVITANPVTDPNYAGIRFKTLRLGGEKKIIALCNKIMEMPVNEITEDEGGIWLSIKPDIYSDELDGVARCSLLRRDNMKLIDVYYGDSWFMGGRGIVVGDEELVKRIQRDSYEVNGIYYYVQD